MDKLKLGNMLLAMLLLVGSISLLPAAAPTQKFETHRFDSQPGDTLVVENDYGRVRVSAWANAYTEVRVRTIANEETQLGNVSVVAQKSGSKLFIQAYFYDYRAETVYLDIHLPAQTNVIVWGANAAVEATQIEGFVRAQTLTGFITGEDLKSSASLLTETGNILYRATVQPQGDVRLESTQGDVNCRVQKDLNLRGWIRAGGKLSWNQELEMTRGALEKQLGVGGPLLMANSQEGNVTFKIEDSMQPQTRVEPAFPDPPEEDQPQQTSTTAPSKGSPPVLIHGEMPEEPHSEGPVAAQPTPRGPRPVPVSTAPADSNAGGSYSLKVNVDWVYVNASVRDRYTNRAVPNLVKDDFLIYEDGVEQNISHLDTNEAPFNLLLLLDVSGSTKSYMDLIKEASVGFTQQIKSTDRVALATFNSRTRLAQDFTNDREEVGNAIRRIKSGGGTAFYDALDRCIHRYMRDVEGRKAVVVFTDGVDNQLTGDYSNGSQINFRDLYRGIQEEDTLIYTIFLDTEAEHGMAGGSPAGGIGGVIDIIFGRRGPSGVPGGGWGGDPAYDEARRELEMIADQTGGRMYAPRDARDLHQIYREIAEDLRIQYTLGYHSMNANQDGEWREIDVRIRNRDDLAVRARKGYYGNRGG
ncbi:MAG: VWA domain-containing protein [Acidobacteriota bacterium]|nr:MAG: VWA domain-containing protein [Acidobacteriota bacterium]